MADLNDSAGTPSAPADTDTSPITSEVSATLSGDGLNISATDKGEVSITDRIKASFKNTSDIDISADGAGFKYSEELSIQEKIRETLNRTVTNKNEVALNKDGLKISETLSDSYNYNDKLTYTDKSDSSVELNGDGFTAGMTNEQSLDYRPTDYISGNITHRDGIQVTNKNVSYENSVSTSEKIGTDNNHVKHNSKYGFTLSSDKGLGLSGEESVGVKTDGFEANSSVKSTASFDGEKLKAGYETNNSVKFGDKDNNVELYNKSSVSADSEGGTTKSNTQGMNVKTENVEFGSEQTHSVSETEDSVEETHQSKETVGVKVADGVKVKNTTTHETSEKVSESEDAITEESSESIKSETRIEVDAEKAGIGAAIGAKMFNIGMAIGETAMESESSSETVTPKQQEPDPEQQEAAAEEASEAEAEAEAEEEKSIKEQVEEDTRVNEELNRKSEELMDEHENAMEVDRAEYAKELEDYSYDQPGEGKTGLESVNFDEGESAGPDSGGESADYSYGY